MKIVEERRVVESSEGPVGSYSEPNISLDGKNIAGLFKVLNQEGFRFYSKFSQKRVSWEICGEKREMDAPIRARAHMKVNLLGYTLRGKEGFEVILENIRESDYLGHPGTVGGDVRSVNGVGIKVSYDGARGDSGAVNRLAGLIEEFYRPNVVSHPIDHWEGFESVD